MKKDNFWNKILVFINTIVAMLLLLSYLLPFISPKLSPTFTIISLSVPLLFLLNVFFLIYWIIKLKKYLIISFLAIVLGVGYISSIYKFSEKNIFLKDDLVVMSYNVRLFNHYNWTTDNAIAEKISTLITEKKPDVISIQEYFEAENLQISYPDRKSVV